MKTKIENIYSEVADVPGYKNVQARVDVALLGTLNPYVVDAHLLANEDGHLYLVRILVYAVSYEVDIHDSPYTYAYVDEDVFRFTDRSRAIRYAISELDSVAAYACNTGSTINYLLDHDDVGAIKLEINEDDIPF